jgi:tryptophan synthase alpha chain
MSERPIEKAFTRCRAEGRAALITYLAAGDPDLQTTIELAHAVADGGADILELGIPFSDPLADGPVIQAAYTRALANGASVQGVLDIIPAIVRGTGLPVVLMTACNPVMAYGEERFCQEAAGRGASGLLIPDLLPEDSASFRQTAQQAGLDTIYLAAPGTADRRLAEAADHSSGFLYLISRQGVTGMHGGPDESLETEVARARQHTDIPIAVGFGVSSAQEASRVAGVADGVIVGSALVQTAAESFPESGSGTPAGVERKAVESAVKSVRRLTGELMDGILMTGHD